MTIEASKKDELGTNIEKNKFFLYTDPDTGMKLDDNIKKIQHEMLQTIDTEFIKVNYRIELLLKHEGTFGAVQEVPSLFFPCIITRDAKGAIDTGSHGQIAT